MIYSGLSYSLLTNPDFDDLKQKSNQVLNNIKGMPLGELVTFETTPSFKNQVFAQS
jgi:hypothetical protein